MPNACACGIHRLNKRLMPAWVMMGCWLRRGSLRTSGDQQRIVAAELTTDRTLEKTPCISAVSLITIGSFHPVTVGVEGHHRGHEFGH